MLFGSGKVATVMACQRLHRVRHPNVAGATFAKGKLKRLVGDCTGYG
jgi:hypothetical protein